VNSLITISYHYYSIYFIYILIFLLFHHNRKGSSGYGSPLGLGVPLGTELLVGTVEVLGAGLWLELLLSSATQDPLPLHFPVVPPM
jgi:hypothetical protein